MDSEREKDVTGNEVAVIRGVAAGYRCDRCGLIRSFNRIACACSGPVTPSPAEAQIRQLREALEKARAGIDDVAAQASLCAHHVVPHEHQRAWLRSEVRREADAAQRAARAALSSSLSPVAAPQEEP